MQAPRKPANEAARLQALRRYRILDSEPERCFDDLVQLAAYISGCPMAAISLIDEDRQWFKAKIGVDVEGSDREISFCGHTILQKSALVVEDAGQDERFADNPLVCGPIAVKFYAGYPLITADGYAVGSLCVIDQKPRSLDTAQMSALKALSQQVVDQLNSRLRVIELEESHRQFEAIANTLGDCIWVSNPDLTKNEYISPAFTTIFERTPDEMQEDAARYFAYIHPEDRKMVLQALHAGDFDMTYRILRPSGEARWVNSRSYPVKDDDGVLVKMVGVTADITDRVEQEQMIEHQRAQLVSSNRLTSLGEMAAGIAHEINNPLAIIGGLAQILQAEMQKGELHTDVAIMKLDKINQTVVRIAKIINSLKMLARDSTSEQTTEVDLHDVVSDAMDLCQTRFRNRNIELDVKVSEGPQFVSGHRFQLSQVLVNLLNNAFDATAPVAKRKIEVEILDQSEFVTLRVLDNGPDIPPEVLEKLMQPFYTTKPPGHGLGIGLSLSKSIVEGFGGRLRFHRADGQTEVAATFPKVRRGAVA